ncbi:unnamed protein product, partial [Prorocentrum cordatum]
VWLCHKVGSWVRSFRRLGDVLLRAVHRRRISQKVPEYGHLLLDSFYPGQRPSAEAARRARELVEESRSAKDPRQSLQLLAEAALLNPPDPELHLERARAHERFESFIEALDECELCVSLDPSCAAGWLCKGHVERALGRTADAELSYQAGLQVEPSHPEFAGLLAALRAEPPPNLMMQLRELISAGRLGLETLFRTVEDPEKVTDAFVESQREVLDAQMGLLGQTLRVNVAVLLDSAMLCDAYEQIIFACSQLVSGAPGAFSRCLQNAEQIIEGLSMALRVGWHVHHSLPKLAANALVMLAICPTAEDRLRRLALRQLLAGMLRWLMDAQPEVDREVEEVCGCVCSVPWKAAACFLDRLFETGRPHQWVKDECEGFADIVQLCQWLTLAARDYRATPLGLVALLQLPGVARAGC